MTVYKLFSAIKFHIYTGSFTANQDFNVVLKKNPTSRSSSADSQDVNKFYGRVCAAVSVRDNGTSPI